MKKLFYLVVCACALTFAVSCGKCDKAAEEVDTLGVDTLVVDTLAADTLLCEM